MTDDKKVYSLDDNTVFSSSDKSIIVAIRDEQAKALEKLNELHEDIALLKQAIRGNGTKGLCDRLEEQEIKSVEIEKIYNKLNMRLWVFMAVMLTANGGSAYGILSLM